MRYPVDAQAIAAALWEEMEKAKPDGKPFDVPLGLWGSEEQIEAYRVGYRYGLAHARELLAREATGQSDPLFGRDDAC